MSKDEVKRYVFPVGGVSSCEDTSHEFVLAFDHDRIVAELNKTLKRTIDLANSVANEREETIAAQAREIEELKGGGARFKVAYERECKNTDLLRQDLLEAEKELAKAKMVIKIAKRVLHNAGLRPPDGGQPTVDTICEDLNDAIMAIAAIENEKVGGG
jgi:multidrug resistance efflux pump